MGTFGDVAAMSVMSGKSLAVGEGGMLVRPYPTVALPVLVSMCTSVSVSPCVLIFRWCICLIASEIVLGLFRAHAGDK